MKIGEINELKLLRFTSVGAYLCDEDDNEVLLPNKYLTDDMDVDDTLSLFVYRDSEDRVVATTEAPFINLNGFAYLKVTSVDFVGAFMDWGLEKELLVPFKEQNKKLEEGKYYLTYLQLDEKTDRVYGSTKTNKYLEPCTVKYDPDKLVDLLVCDRTDLGQKVIVEGKYSGLIFKNDISKPLRRGQKIRGYVYNMRPDGKLDIRLDKVGGKKILDSSDYLLDILKKRKVLHLNDKSDPEIIREAVGMSKKTFKQAIGTLYRKRLVSLDDNKVTYLGD